eukprot:1014354-Amorphochlora_amoeboformis.AAC.1
MRRCFERGIRISPEPYFAKEIFREISRDFERFREISREDRSRERIAVEGLREKGGKCRLPYCDEGYELFHGGYVA